MRISIRHSVATFAALFLSFDGAQIAAAAQVQYFSAVDYVQGGLDLNYADLALEFAPGLDGEPTDGAALSKLPHLGGSDMASTSVSPTLGSVRRVDFSLGGKPAMLVMFDLGQSDDSVASVNILALYDMTNGPQLLDTMDVGLDRETSFTEPAVMELSPRFGVAFVRNSHHNAGEEYLQTSLIGIWGSKLHEVDTIMSMSWNGGDRQVETRFSFAAVKDAVAFDASASIRTTHCDGGCEPDRDVPADKERLTVRYEWDQAKGKFLPNSREFKKIPLPDMEQ